MGIVIKDKNLIRCGFCKKGLPTLKEARKKKLIKGNSIKCENCNRYSIFKL